MKKYGIFILAMLLSVVLISEEKIDTTSYEIFSTEILGFKLNVACPDYWLVEKELGGIFVFLSPKENEEDYFQENFNIVVQDLRSNPMKLEEYTSASIDYLPDFIDNMDIVDSGYTDLSGYEAFKIIYTGKHMVYDLKWFQAWTIVDDIAFIATYTAEIEKYDKYINIIDSMMTSFSIE